MTTKPTRMNLAAILATRLDDRHPVTKDHLKLLEKSLQLGALLEAIAKGHDPLLANDVMSHGKLRSLIDLAIRVRDELDEPAVAICGRCDEVGTTSK